MDKKNIVMWIVTILITIALLMFISKLVFSGANSLNEGPFRVTDAIVTSSAEVEDINDVKEKWEINISQTNRVSILIKGMDNIEISKVEIDKMKIINKPKIGDLYLSEPKTKEVKNVKTDGSDNVAVYVEKKTDGNNLIELDIINKDIINNFIVKEETKELRHDATAIALAGKTLKDISFKVSFRLNITSKDGKISRCNIFLDLPEDSLLTNGYVVTRLDLGQFKFKI